MFWHRTVSIGVVSSSLSLYAQDGVLAFLTNNCSYNVSKM